MKNTKCKLTSKCLAAFSFDLLYLFSYSSAILSTLPCQVHCKLAFQSQTPRAESPDQTFLWKFVLKQLGKSEQNKQILYAEFLVTSLFTLEMGLSSPPGAASVISVEPHPHRWAELLNPGWTRGVCCHSQWVGKQLPYSTLPTGTRHWRDNSTDVPISTFSPEGNKQTKVYELGTFDNFSDY